MLHGSDTETNEVWHRTDSKMILNLTPKQQYFTVRDTETLLNFIGSVSVTVSYRVFLWCDLSWCVGIQPNLPYDTELEVTIICVPLFNGAVPSRKKTFPTAYFQTNFAKNRQLRCHDTELFSILFLPSNFI